VSEAYRGRVANAGPSVALSVPLTNDGRGGGVLGGAIGLDAFQAMREQSSQARGFEMLVLDRNDAVVHATAGLPQRMVDAMRRAAPKPVFSSIGQLMSWSFRPA